MNKFQVYFLFAFIQNQKYSNLIVINQKYNSRLK